MPVYEDVHRGLLGNYLGLNSSNSRAISLRSMVDRPIYASKVNVGVLEREQQTLMN